MQQVRRYPDLDPQIAILSGIYWLRFFCSDNAGKVIESEEKLCNGCVITIQYNFEMYYFLVLQNLKF